MPKLRSFNIASYRDCEFVMESALRIPGLQYVCENRGAAINFKQRCNKLRRYLRDLDAERIGNIPGYAPESRFDILTIRQLDASGSPSQEGCIVQFDHEVKRGKIINPQTGEEIPLPKTQLDLDPLEGLTLAPVDLKGYNDD
jgi:hypothetical protein